MTFTAEKHAKTAKTPKLPEMPEAIPQIKKKTIEAMTHAPDMHAAFVCWVMGLEAASVPCGLNGWEHKLNTHLNTPYHNRGICSYKIDTGLTGKGTAISQPISFHDFDFIPGISLCPEWFYSKSAEW